MKIVLAPDKFKGSLSAREVCVAMSQGVREVDPRAAIAQCPMSDGGEGFVDAVLSAVGGRLLERRVTGPLAEMLVDATFGLLADGQTAVIEMSAASGLHLLRPEQYDPISATTRGTGELILAAVEHGATKILLGAGGSATCDGGAGCAEACRHLDVGRIQITVACDVSNPLYGPDGAAFVFAPQKGASPEQVNVLDQRLRRLAEDLKAHDVAARPGSGAAGGLAFGLAASFGATLVPGARLVMGLLNLRDRLSDADLCITGEGRLDQTSAGGKVSGSVAVLCNELGVPCAAVCGQVDMDFPQFCHTAALVAHAADKADAMSRAAALVARCTADIVNAFLRARSSER
ncbi:MAG: glycerate kinase [Tepidisphaeraceae bacterium]